MVKAGDDLSGYIPEDRQYIYVELCDGQRFIHRVLEERRSAGTVPLQFGRQIIAKALACPERTNWKSCIVPPSPATGILAVWVFCGSMFPNPFFFTQRIAQFDKFS